MDLSSPDMAQYRYVISLSMFLVWDSGKGKLNMGNGMPVSVLRSHLNTHRPCFIKALMKMKRTGKNVTCFLVFAAMHFHSFYQRRVMSSPWYLKLETDSEVSRSQQFVQSAQYQTCVYCSYQNRRLGTVEALNWIWDWEERFCSACWKADLLKKEVKKLLHEWKRSIMLVICICCQAGMRSCCISLMAWVEIERSSSRCGFEGVLCKCLWFNGWLQNVM